MKVNEASDLLESDYESEFVMATRLLEKVMGRLDLSQTENEEKPDNLFKKINWPYFPGVQALLMKVRWCYEASTSLLQSHVEWRENSQVSISIHFGSLA